MFIQVPPPTGVPRPMGSEVAAEGCNVVGRNEGRGSVLGMRWRIPGCKGVAVVM